MTTLSHSNFNLHRLLTDQGACVHVHYPDSFEDVGDAENGPELTGGPAYDEYTCDSHTFIVDSTGTIVFTAAIDWDFERFASGMAEAAGEGIMGDPSEDWVPRRRAGEDFAVCFHDEDGSWYAMHTGWCDRASDAHPFHRAHAEQVAHEFNARPHDRIVGRARVIDYPAAGRSK